MADIQVVFRACVVKTLPEVKDGKNGKFLKFSVKNDGDTYTIIAFDDERDVNPFKTISNAFERGAIKKGTYLYLECILSSFDTYAISDERWKKYSATEKNPTKVRLSTFKLRDWDFLLPKEIYELLKKDSAQESTKAQKPKILAPLEIKEGGVL